MLSRMIKRGVGWSRRPPMHVGSRDAGERRPRVLNPMCIGMPERYTHTGGVEVGRCVQCEAAGSGRAQGQARLRAGRASGRCRSRLVIAPTYVIVSYTYSHSYSADNYIAGLQRRRKHTTETQSQIHYISILNGRRHSLGLAFHLRFRRLGSRYWLGRGREIMLA